MADDDPMIPVMLPTSVVKRVADGWATDDEFAVVRIVGDACRDALPKVVTIEIPVEVRDMWAERATVPYADDHYRALTDACRASRDAEEADRG